MKYCPEIPVDFYQGFLYFQSNISIQITGGNNEQSRIDRRSGKGYMQ